jgi:glyoxylate carboligase
VSDDDLRQSLAAYRPGLDAEISLLRQLERLAEVLRDAPDEEAIATMTRVIQERDVIMAALVTIEHELQPARAALVANREAASRLEGFAEVAALHRVASDLVATIVHADHDALCALHDAEAARRFAAQTLGAADSTVAAYRRVVAPSLTAAGLVDRRG